MERKNDIVKFCTDVGTLDDAVSYIRGLYGYDGCKVRHRGQSRIDYGYGVRNEQEIEFVVVGKFRVSLFYDVDDYDEFTRLTDIMYNVLI